MIKKKKHFIFDPVPKKFANPINKQVHCMSLFIRFASREGNISHILNSMCVDLYAGLGGSVGCTFDW